MAQLWWPRVSHWCQEALVFGSGLMWLEDVVRAVAERDMQMWVIHAGQELKAVCITEIRVFPRGKALTVLLVGGNDMPAWAPALDDTLTRYGRACGCAVLDAYARKGWSKTLRSLNWVDRCALFAKDIRHE